MVARRWFGIVFFAVLAGSAHAGGAADETVEPLEHIRTLLAQGRYADAEAGARELLDEVDPDAVTGSPAIHDVFDVLVEARWRGGKARDPETLELGRRAVALKERLPDPGSADIAESLNNLAVILFFRGEYDEAGESWERALAIRERTSGADGPGVAQILNGLANLWQTTGDYAKAREAYERALEIREAAFGGEDPLVAQTLNNLAVLRKNMGDYAQALPLAERALEIRERALGAEHPKVATSLTALANIVTLMGDYDRAVPLFERTVAVWESSLGPEHPQVGASLNNLAEPLRDLGRYDEARGLYERALAIWEKAYGPEHPRVAVCLSSLGTLYEQMGQLDRARSVQARAVAIREAGLGADHPLLATSLDSQGALLARAGDYAAAGPLLERALTIREQTFGGAGPAVAESLGHLATLEAARGSRPVALDRALEAERVARDHLRLTGRALSEHYALHFAAVRGGGLDLVLELAATGLEPERSRAVLDTVIRSRAVVLDEMAARQRAVGSTTDPKMRRLAEAVVASRARLANLTVRGPGRMPPARYRDLLEDARSTKETTERSLAAASAEFAREQQRGGIGFEQVSVGLPPGSALVSYSLFERDSHVRAAKGESTANGPAYLAIVLRGGSSRPVFADLGPAAEIDALVGRWRREAAGGLLVDGRTTAEAEARYREAGSALRERIWDPLPEEVVAAERLFVVPDGSLHLVSLAALPAGDGGWLVERGPVVHYLSAERDLVASSPGEARGRGLLVVGGPDFEAAEAPVSRGPRSGSRTQVATTAGASPVSLRSGCGDFATMRFTVLPKAGHEADQVVAVWRASAGKGEDSAGVVHLEGGQASEPAVRREAVGRRVIHLATHGFFLGGECFAGQGRRGLGKLAELEPAKPPQRISPLLLSGLALAGANARHRAASGDQDGILTAEELATLDLSGVEWAVLSACDTGVGEITPGEGVLGLRRAMQVAGVRTLITSLWSVDDESTRRWMRALYEARLSRGLDTPRAVRTASLEMLRTRRAAGESDHPFFWAAFVAAGDWR